MAHKLINMKIDLEVLARIDAEAKRSGLSRTAYFVLRCDPAGPSKPCRVDGVPERTIGASPKSKTAPKGKRVAPPLEVSPHVNRLKGVWKAP